MKITPNQIVFQCIAGSRLYGTENNNSDTDIKTIFAHSLDGLITGEDETDRTKDEANNSESEFFSLKKFSQLLGQNQTIGLELLFIPTDKIITTSECWKDLLSFRDKIISKDLMPFIGYARNQAHIYSNKGDRLSFLKQMYEFVADNFNCLDTCEGLTKLLDDSKYTDHWVMSALNENYLSFETKRTPNGREIKQVNILGKGFEEFASPKTWTDRIKIQIDKYGDRAKLAEDNTGHDVKATYHAVRVIEEAIEILKDGRLTFPRPEVQLLLDIRAGKYDYNTTCRMITERANLLEEMMGISILQKSPDKAAINAWFQTWQRKHIYNELGVKHA